MERKVKRLLSITLAVALMAAVMFNSHPVFAAAQPALSKKSADVLIGGSTGFKVKNKPAGASYTWTSSNSKIATVSSAGMVTGKSKGTATITCKVTAGKEYTLKGKVVVRKGATGVKISNSIPAIQAGTSYDLNRTLTPKTSNDKTVWSSSDTAVATIDSNGLIKAKKAGKATIIAKTLSGEESENEVLVTDSAGTVSTQSQLNQLLSSKAITNINLKTNAQSAFAVAKGDYGKKSITVDAPNADMVNSGEFKQINIKAIKDSTWTEKAAGNSFNISAPTARVVVDKAGSVAEIKISKSDSKIAIVADGTVSQVVLDTASQVTVSGTTDVNVPIKVEASAKGAKITANIPITATVNADADIKLDKGAEASKIDKGNEDVAISVKNNTSATVDVTTNGKDAQGVGSGSETVVEKPAPGVPDSGGSGGSSGSGGGSSGPSTSELALKAANAATTDEAVEKFLANSSYIRACGFSLDEYKQLNDVLQKGARASLLDSNFKSTSEVKNSFESAVKEQKAAAKAIVEIGSVAIWYDTVANASEAAKKATAEKRATLTILGEFVNDSNFSIGANSDVIIFADSRFVNKENAALIIESGGTMKGKAISSKVINYANNVIGSGEYSFEKNSTYSWDNGSWKKGTDEESASDSMSASISASEATTATASEPTTATASEPTTASEATTATASEPTTASEATTASETTTESASASESLSVYHSESISIASGGAASPAAIVITPQMSRSGLSMGEHFTLIYNSFSNL